MSELVSVVLTTYNRKNTIQRAIDSVLNQTYKNIELIIVDDNSSDGTFEFVSELYGDDERILYIINDVNLGPSGARNAGIDAARGNWIAFHDSDDEWHKDKLEKQMAIAKNCDEHVGMIYSQIKRIWSDGDVDIYPPDSVSDKYKSGNIHPYVLIFPLCSTQSMLIRRACLEQVGGFETEIASLDDYEMSIRISQHFDVILCNEPLVDVYESSDSVGKRNTAKIQAQCLIMNRYISSLRKFDLRDIKMQMVWNEAQFYHAVDSLEDSMEAYSLIDDPEYARAFEYLEAERREEIFKQCKRRIGIFLNDEHVTFGNGRRPEQGNPGIGGSEYEMLLLIRYLSKEEYQNLVTVYHLNRQNVLPWEVKDIIVDDKYQAISQCEVDKQDAFVFVFEDDEKWYDILERHTVHGVCWQTNFLEYYDSVLQTRLHEIKAIEKIVCVSKSMFEHYREQTIQKKMCWIYNMWDCGNVMIRDTKEIEKNVTYLGGMYYQKGFHILAQAWKKIIAKVPDAHLHVIGSAKLYSDDIELGPYGIADEAYESLFMPFLLDERGELLPSVTFHGLMGIEKNELIASTSVGVVNPSGVTETFCISAVEFESAGVPVVSKMTYGVCDTVIANQTGILISDAEQLADAVIDLLLNEERNVAYGNAAYVYVHNRFVPELIIKEWNELFDSMIVGKSESDACLDSV